MEETKVIYYIDDEDTPYMMKIMESPSKVTLKDFKAQLNRPYKKFYFRSTDDDIGTVKEEIASDDMSLPNVNGRVVCWVCGLPSFSSLLPFPLPVSQTGF
jgi:segment polarity protein dishevelled